MGWYEELQQERLDRMMAQCTDWELKCRDLKKQVVDLKEQVAALKKRLREDD